MNKSFLLYVIFFTLCFNFIKNDLYVDPSIKYAKYEDFNKNSKAGLVAIGNMEGLDVQVSNGLATLTTKEIWHGWHGASLGQVPPTSTTSSYFSFSEVEKIKFKIKSNDVSPTEIKVFLQAIEGSNLLERPLTDLGIDNIKDFTDFYKY